MVHQRQGQMVYYKIRRSDTMKIETKVKYPKVPEGTGSPVTLVKVDELTFSLECDELIPIGDKYEIFKEVFADYLDKSVSVNDMRTMCLDLSRKNIVHIKGYSHDSKSQLIKKLTEHFAVDYVLKN